MNIQNMNVTVLKIQKSITIKYQLVFKTYCFIILAKNIPCVQKIIKV